MNSVQEARQHKQKNAVNDSPGMIHLDRKQACRDTVLLHDDQLPLFAVLSGQIVDATTLKHLEP